LIKPDNKKTVIAKSDPRAEMPALLREADPNERMAHLIKLAFRGLSRGLQTRLRKHSILYGHWTLLRILWRMDGMTQRQLSEQAGVTEPTAFGALQAMEKLGFVTRQKMPDNGKQIRIFLTAKGAALKSLIVPAAEECNRIALAGIAENDMAVTRRTLLTIIENLVVNDLQMSEMSDDAAGAEDAEEADKVRIRAGAGAKRKDAA
jgi:DNA-binding MarR family transcriptional regulator